MALTMADEPSAVGTDRRHGDAEPAKQAAPRTTRRTSSRQFARQVDVERDVPTASTTSALERQHDGVRADSAPMYAAGGSGVPRTRFSMPRSRRMTSVMARPANVVSTTAKPSMPGMKTSA